MYLDRPSLKRSDSFQIFQTTHATQNKIDDGAFDVQFTLAFIFLQIYASYMLMKHRECAFELKLENAFVKHSAANP